jgi:DNA-binding MarR family transcriptional regulator
MARRRPEQVADLLHSASIHLLRRAGEGDAATGLSAARLSALSVIVFRGPLTIRALAEAERVRSPTMSGIVNGLEGSRLVCRRPDSRDRRAVLVEATAAGRRLLSRGRARRIEAVAQRLADLSQTELTLLWRAGQLLEERFASRPWRPASPDRQNGPRGS